MTTPDAPKHPADVTEIWIGQRKYTVRVRPPQAPKAPEAKLLPCQIDGKDYDSPGLWLWKAGQATRCWNALDKEA